MTLVEDIANRLVPKRDEKLPGDVRALAQMCLLDQIGLQMHGTKLPHVAPVLEVARSLGGAGEARVPMLEIALPARYAALVSATLGHSCEFDDAHFLCGHPGVCVIPTVLALGQHLHSSGADVLAALVAGYEAMVLAVGPIHPTTMTTGWHGTKMSGVFGAAMATSMLYGFDAATTAQAFAIAGSDVSGTSEYDQSGGEVKRVHPGLAARAGIEAALLAKGGLTGPLTILEGPRGIHRLFGDGSEPQVSSVFAKEYHIRDVMFKMYPAVGTHQAPIEAIRHLMATERFAHSDVERIVISSASWSVEHGGATDQPRDMISAQFNLGFSLAIRLVKDSNALSIYMDPALWEDPVLLELASKVEIQPKTYAAGESQLGAEIALELADGRRLTRQQATFRGQAADPAQVEDIEAKFRELVSDLVTDARADEIVETVRRTEELADISELTDLLQP